MNDRRLPKKTVLKGSRDFGNVFLRGQYINCEYFSVYFVKQTELRIGFTTKKDYKNKPTRNRMKRILRELWRKNYIKYDLPAHIVIVANNNILRADYNRLDDQMNDVLTQLEKKMNKARSEQEK